MAQLEVTAADRATAEALLTRIQFSSMRAKNVAMLAAALAAVRAEGETGLGNRAKAMGADAAVERVRYMVEQNRQHGVRGLELSNADLSDLVLAYDRVKVRVEALEAAFEALDGTQKGTITK